MRVSPIANRVMPVPMAITQGNVLIAIQPITGVLNSTTVG